MVRIVSVALLLGAMLANSAAAECAWVTWQQNSYRGSEPDDWATVAAYPTHRECEAQVRAKMRGWLQGGATKLAENAVKFNENHILTARVVCLPDTVDPRGPKGK